MDADSFKTRMMFALEYIMLRVIIQFYVYTLKEAFQIPSVNGDVIHQPYFVKIDIYSSIKYIHVAINCRFILYLRCMLR